MPIFYSKTTGGFYDSQMNATIPSDAVQITADQHNVLLVAQSNGQVISADANGNPVAITPTPQPAPPLQATPYQFKAALVQQNLYTQALAAVNAGPLLTQLAWAEALIFTETDPLIVSMATALGQTTAQVHALFQLAATLSP